MSDARIPLSGVIPPLPTPTTADGAPDLPMLRRVIDYVLAAGAQGVVPLGGVGEFNSLCEPDRRRVVDATVEHVDGRVPVVAGVVQTSLHDSVASALSFRAAGVDAVLTLPPYYQQPTQQGVREYFTALHDRVDLPVIVYDTPDLTHFVLAPETLAAMVDDGSVAGLKASNSSIDHFSRLIGLVGGRIPVLAGETPLFPVYVAMGADGGMIGNSCLLPRYFVRMFALVKANRLDEALWAHRRLLGFTDALAAAGYFPAFKQAMSLVGLDCGAPLLPLRAVPPAAFDRVRVEFEHLRQDGVLEDVTAS